MKKRDKDLCFENEDLYEIPAGTPITLPRTQRYSEDVVKKLETYDTHTIR